VEILLTALPSVPPREPQLATSVASGVTLPAIARRAEAAPTAEEATAVAVEASAVVAVEVKARVDMVELARPHATPAEALVT
jgi:hypothetical protein